MNETLKTDKHTDTDEQFSDSSTISKEYFIEQCTKELGGGFFAKLDASILYELYVNWKNSPINAARMFYEACHAAVGNAIMRQQAKRKHLL